MRDLIAAECPSISFSFCIFPTKTGGASHVLDRFPPLSKFDRVALDYGSMTTPNGPWTIEEFRANSETWAAPGKPAGLDTWLQWAQANNKQIEFQEWGIGAMQQNNGAAILGYYELFWKWRNAMTADGTKRVLAAEMIFRGDELDLTNGNHPDALWVYRRLWGENGGVAPNYSHPLWDVDHNWKNGAPNNYQTF